MQPIIYDVAVSRDGFIAGPEGDISRFAHDGPVVDDYRARLATYGTALMGRKTYEFGFAYGLSLGQNPYPHMRSIVVSTRLKLPPEAEVEHVSGDVRAVVARLQREARAPLYLCGGGDLAGALVDAGLIDTLCLKRAPFEWGDGVPLFGARGRNPRAVGFVPGSQEPYSSGIMLERWDKRVPIA